jgi:hypothetical protein
MPNLSYAHGEQLYVFTPSVFAIFAHSISFAALESSLCVIFPRSIALWKAKRITSNGNSSDRHRSNRVRSGFVAGISLCHAPCELVVAENRGSAQVNVGARRTLCFDHVGNGLAGARVLGCGLAAGRPGNRHDVLCGSLDLIDLGKNLVEFDDCRSRGSLESGLNVGGDDRISHDMKETYRRFVRWRRSHTGRLPIPEPLWTAAAEVAWKCGINATAKVLRLEYGRLKEKTLALGRGEGGVRIRRTVGRGHWQSRPPAFVELFAPPSSGGSLECRVQLEGRHGKMRIEFKGIATSVNKGEPVLEPPDTTRLDVPLGEIRPLEFLQVRRGPEEPLFNHLIAEYHPLGYARPVGEHLKYMVYAAGRPIACLAWASAPRHLSARDRYIGWTPEARRRNLRYLAYNPRFLVLPWVQVKHLASHILGQMARRLAENHRLRLRRLSA